MRGRPWIQTVKDSIAAVRSLMIARHGLPKVEFTRLVEELIAANILEEVASKGSTALRLTAGSRLVMSDDAEALEQAMAIPSPKQSNDVTGESGPWIWMLSGQRRGPWHSAMVTTAFPVTAKLPSSG